ncbi:MAG TPA: hypothetical protein VFR25_04715 [Candidatus Eisenbacteria bacterium]|nr:hypothetical protein [Candidatus Eisenbacteria bacterium]
MNLIPEMVRVAILGGVLAVDRAAGWSTMLSQPIVGACLAGALVNPGPEWELWALRVPIGVGAILQLLLTDASLPAAQRQHDTATAGVVGSTVALLGMVRLHSQIPAALGGGLWVLVGVAAGLLSAVAGGWVMGYHRARSRRDVARAEELAGSDSAEGEAALLDALEGVRAGRRPAAKFELLYWMAMGRVFLVGAFWSWAGSLLGLMLAIAVLPMLGEWLTGRRIGFVFATTLGAALAAGYHAHVRSRRAGGRWMALGAAAALVLLAMARQTNS